MKLALCFIEPLHLIPYTEYTAKKRANLLVKYLCISPELNISSIYNYFRRDP